MSDTDTTTLSVGIGGGGVLLVMKKGDEELSVTLDVNEAYMHQGHVLAAAITLEQSVYVQRMQEQMQTQRMYEELKNENMKPGGKLWHP